MAQVPVAWDCCHPLSVFFATALLLFRYSPRCLKVKPIIIHVYNGQETIGVWYLRAHGKGLFRYLMGLAGVRHRVSAEEPPRLLQFQQAIEAVCASVIFRFDSAAPRQLHVERSNTFKVMSSWMSNRSAVSPS